MLRRLFFAHRESKYACRAVAELEQAGVPRARVREIEQLASRHHPEVGVGGVGWTLASGRI